MRIDLYTPEAVSFPLPRLVLAALHWEIDDLEKHLASTQAEMASISSVRSRRCQ
jgi:hypothetical protein